MSPLSITRRNFLGQTCALVSSTVVSTAWTSATFGATAKGDSHGRILVIIQLDGGNDGLNTVVPYEDDAYYRARPSLAIAKRAALRVDATAGLGLNPHLRGLADLYGNGQVAIAQGVGYPNPNRSHFLSMDVWHSAVASGERAGRASEGWLGKGIAAAKHAKEASQLMALGPIAPLAVHGGPKTALNHDLGQTIGWTGTAFSESLDRLRTANAAVSRSGLSEYVRAVQANSIETSSRLVRAIDADSADRFPRTGLARKLSLVLSMIQSQFPASVYFVTLGGFDTHSQQARRQSMLLREFGDAVHAFQNQVTRSRLQSRVMTLAFSEFGRQVQENQSGGTDHGSAGPVCLIGDGVQAGMRGDAPKIDLAARDDLAYTLDYRCIYAEILDKWLGSPSPVVLGKAFKHAGLVRTT